MFRFTFPAATRTSSSTTSTTTPRSRSTRRTASSRGYSDVRSGLSDGATRMFVYATFDKPMTADATATGARTGYAKFDTAARQDRDDADRHVADQPRPGAQEPRAGDRPDRHVRRACAARAQAQWDDKLDVIEVEGGDRGPADDAVLEPLPPVPLSELGAREHRHARRARLAARRAVVVGRRAPTIAPAVADGKVYVNNGFWDTYRTAWSAYSLFSPGTAGELVDGFVQQYRDGGWVARWSSPGYANLMTGTSSDVSFADAYVKGVARLRRAGRLRRRAQERDRRAAGLGPEQHAASGARA